MRSEGRDDLGKTRGLFVEAIEGEEESIVEK